jgi:hypothetical protein
MGTTYKVIAKAPDGNVLGTFFAEVEAIAANSPAPEAAPASASDGNDRMTDPQRRYLFRLLGAQGLQGDAAEGHLKARFKVASLKEVSKAAASALIDELANAKKG